MPPIFFCDLCQKGYARANELEAHENSYDHQHKKRLKEMKAMTRPTAFGATRKRNNDVMSGNIKGTGSERKGGGFKPIGAATITSAVPAADTKASTKEEIKTIGVTEGSNDSPVLQEEYVTIEGPIPWESLGEVGELVDLTFARPKELQSFLDSQRAHMAGRTSRDFYREVWDKVSTGRVRTASESPPRAVGLGA